MLNDLQQEWCEISRWDFSDPKALFINCTLKRSPGVSHTQVLIDIASAIMGKNGVSHETMGGRLQHRLRRLWRHDRVCLSQFKSTERPGPICLIGARRLLSGYWQRGWRLVLRHERALFAAAFGLWANTGWLGEAGPGLSYLDEGSGGPENDLTNRNTNFMTWNLLHSARMIKDAGGFPVHGN